MATPHGCAGVFPRNKCEIHALAGLAPLAKQQDPY